MRLKKDYTSKEYADLAIYCNENGLILEDKGEYIEAVLPPQDPEPSYEQKRMADYPPLRDQLDMIYWDKINGTNIWMETITNIKTKHPKE